MHTRPNVAVARNEIEDIYFPWTIDSQFVYVLYLINQINLLMPKSMYFLFWKIVLVLKFLVQLLENQKDEIARSL